LEPSPGIDLVQGEHSHHVDIESNAPYSFSVTCRVNTPGDHYIRAVAGGRDADGNTREASCSVKIILQDGSLHLEGVSACDEPGEPEEGRGAPHGGPKDLEKASKMMPVEDIELNKTYRIRIFIDKDEVPSLDALGIRITAEKEDYHLASVSGRQLTKLIEHGIVFTFDESKRTKLRHRIDNK
jgi:hypothetical protein